MPPKRKRTDAGTTAEASTTRPSRKSSRITRGKNAAADVTNDTSTSNTVEPPSKKTRAKRKTDNKKGQGSVPHSGVDDEPLNSTTNQSDDELVTPQEGPSTPVIKAEYTKKGAQALFMRFADDDNPDVIGPGGVEKLCNEAGIPLEGAQPLLLAWQFKAQEMAKVTRSEWFQGTDALRISSLPVLAFALKELEDLVVHDKEAATSTPSLPSVKQRNADSRELYNRTRYLQYASDRTAAFSDLYQFCFALAKPAQSRNLDIETAVALWTVLLAPRYPITTDLIEFLNGNGSYKAANRDIWNMVHEFCQTINSELSNYEADGAWPTMLDDFVDWRKSRVANPAYEGS